MESKQPNSDSGVLHCSDYRPERESRRLIDAAYDAGIRHFDVARSYGYGAVEGLLGKTLGSRRANVTITTKFGLPVPKSQALLRPLRTLGAADWSSGYPGCGARSKSVLSAIGSTVEFNPQEASRSLKASLKELRTSYIDLFLLHEVRADLLSDNRLLDFLQQSVHEGTIRAHGVGSRSRCSTRSDTCAIRSIVRWCSMNGRY